MTEGKQPERNEDAKTPANIEDVLDGKVPFSNIPLADFSQAEPRKAMQDALALVENNLGKDYPFVIGGELLHSDDKSVSLNPSHIHQEIGHISKASTVDVGDAIIALDGTPN